MAGGSNPFGEPMFRVVWGYDRIVPIHGKWEQWEQFQATLTDKKTGFTDVRHFSKLTSSVVETRHVPKYLPANCWHLEMWRPAEEYGSLESWRKQGEEVADGMTVDTSGPYPERGEYELCYPLTHDATSRGEPIPLVGDVVEELVYRICRDREKSIPFQQRRAAIEQRERKREEGLLQRTIDVLKDGLRPFAGEEFVTVPETPRIISTEE